MNVKIMVTGATGDYGRYALAYLQKFAPDADLYGLVRRDGQGADLSKRGIHLRVGDYANLPAMTQALRGIDRLLFVSTPTPAVQKNVVLAAQKNQVGYVAYTSIYRPDLAKFGLERNHLQTERWLKSAGLHYTALRNDWYLEVNQAMFTMAKRAHAFPYFSTDGVLSFALKREYAEAGARVISGAGAGEVVNLAGTPVTYPELGMATQTAVGHTLRIQPVTETAFMSQMTQAGIMGAGVADAYQQYACDPQNGARDADLTEFERLLGHPLTPYAAAIRELL